MILADKIINERKKNGWSQEELAEQLSVSRQSVSKWEGAQAVPDLQKIIAMADIFGVSTDYLLKDEIEPENVAASIISNVESVTLSNARRVTIEEANDFLNKSKEKAPKIANGVSLCILSPIVLIFLAGLSEVPGLGISENLAAGLGMLVLLAMIAIAVYIFILAGAKTRKYEFLEKEVIETAYGVDGMAQERMNAMEGRRTSQIAMGVILCILCSVPLIITACLGMAEYIVVFMLCFLLVVVSVAVNLFVRVGIEWGSCEQLLQTGDYTVGNKKVNKKIEKISGIYWGVALAGYLAWSFITMRWDITWIVWPVAAVFFGAISCLIRAISPENTAA